MKKKLLIAAFSLLLLLSGAISLRYYSYVFSKRVYGKILRVERVSDPGAIIAQGSGITPSQLYAFAVAIKDQTGQIHTASSEDRQWAVSQPGQCVETRFFPYPPWQLDKSGTYFGARLLRLSECPNSSQ